MEIKDFTANITVNNNYSLKKFLGLPEVPCQRDTEARLGRARKHLHNVRPEHCIVHLVRLTKDCVVADKVYKAGSVFRVDGNTRALNWERGGTDCLPQKLIAITYEYDDLDGIKKCYDTFDSMEATETNKHKVHGILNQYHDYEPVSKKLKMGDILTGMNKACCLMRPNEWNQSGFKNAEELALKIGYWMNRDCLQALDKLMTVKENWCQAYVAAALMSFYHYGHNNQKLVHAWKSIGKKAGLCPTGDERWDGVTHIVEEWKTGNFFGHTDVCKDSRWSTMDRTVSYLLYWIDKYMEEGENGDLLKQVGKGWEKVAKEYKHRIRYSSSLELAFNIEG